MARVDHHYQILLYREDGGMVGQAAAVVDWQPALVEAWFSGLRSGQDDAACGPGDIRPLWHEQAGRPFLRGFAVQGGGGPRAEFTTAYFHDLAVEASAQLVEQGILDKDESFRYVVTAYDRDRDTPSETGAEAGRGAAAQRLPPRLSTPPADLGPLLERGRPAGPATPGELPFLVPAGVLRQMERRATEAADRGEETGGVLIGHLWRDPARRDLFAEVRALLPARHTTSGRDRLTFTPDTWADLRAALDLRGRDELLLGWFHSHPFRAWCQDRDCPPERRSACRLAGNYFSAQDRVLQRTVFPMPYHLALVVNEGGPGRVTFSGFGWRGGLIVPRGVLVLDDASHAAAWHGEDRAEASETECEECWDGSAPLSPPPLRQADSG